MNTIVKASALALVTVLAAGCSSNKEASSLESIQATANQAQQTAQQAQQTAQQALTAAQQAQQTADEANQRAADRLKTKSRK